MTFTKQWQTQQRLPVVAIDGPAGSGKSSVAKLVANALQLTHIDTGAMYRALTWKALQLKIAVTDEVTLNVMTTDTMIELTTDGKTIVDQQDVSREIRLPEVSANVSAVSAHPLVREQMVRLQREAGLKGAVLEGRDIGTVVFPDAALKVFLVASDHVRAERRKKDFAAMGIEKSIESLVEEMRLRDKLDSERAASPLRKARDAKSLDTTSLTIDEVVDQIVRWAKERGLGNDWIKL